MAEGSSTGGFGSSIKRGTQKLLLAVFGPPDLDHEVDPIEELDREGAREEQRAREERQE